jgi:transposase
MVNDPIRVLARRTAVGMCAQIAEGREAEATMLQRSFIDEAALIGVPVCHALMALAHAAIGVAVAASTDDREEAGAEWFRTVAGNLAVRHG